MTAFPSILPLELERVGYEVDATPLLKEVSCVLRSGPRTVVIGPNGAGKSLFLRLCHGLIAPSRGTLAWRGAGGRDPTPRQAMVFQRPVLLRRSVAANVAFPLSVNGMASAERAVVVAEMLAKTGLSRFAHRPARLLSAGEQQKLALARAWAVKPEVLFLDEPTANLDPAATHAVEGIINDIHAAGTKVIMTTHDLGQARRIADEVLFLHRGELREMAPAKRFFSGPVDVMAQAFIKGELLWWD